MPELVFLVHGTGAASPDDGGDQWWQIGGVMQQALAQAGQEALQFRPFHWSGANSETDRRLAGARLADEIRQQGRGGARVHLVGHSHGGSVIWHALQHLAAHSHEALQPVASACSVGTPYLTFGLRRADMALRAFFAVLAACLSAWLLRSLVGANLRFALAEDRWATLAWAVVTVGALVVAVVALAALLKSVAGAMRAWRTRHALEHLGALSSRFLALWSVQDEPTLGLVSSGSLDQALTPLKSVSQLVNNVLARSLQGVDLPYLELRAVGPHPMPALAHRSLPQVVDIRLVENANAAAALLAGAARGMLLATSDAVTGLQALKRMLPAKLTFKELVHTTYFDDDACRALVVLHISRHAAQPFAGAADQPLADWYATRHLPQAEPVPAAQALPSNRVARYLAVVAAMSVLLAALAALSGWLLAERALAPTTPAYWVDRLARDRTSLEALAGGNYDNFTPVLRRLSGIARHRPDAVPTALWRAAMRAWSGPVRMPVSALPSAVQQLVDARQIRPALDAGWFARLDDADGESMVDRRTRQTAIALASAAVAMAHPPDAVQLLSGLRAACGQAEACHEESLVREIEALAVSARFTDAAAVLAAHPGLDAVHREVVFPVHLSRQSTGSTGAAPLERIADAAIWLAQHGMPRAAARLAHRKLQWCASKPAASADRAVQPVVLALLARPVDSRQPSPSLRLDDVDLVEGAIELAGCGPLDADGLAGVEQALAALRMQQPQQRDSTLYVARAQAYRGNCAAMASRVAWQTPEVLAHLAANGLCPGLAVVTRDETEPARWLAQVRHGPLRGEAIDAFGRLHRQAPDERARTAAVEAFLTRMAEECARSPDAKDGPADPDAFITFINLRKYLQKKMPAKGTLLPPVAKQLADALFRDPLPGCIRPGASAASSIESRVFAAHGLAEWMAPIAPAEADQLQASALRALQGFRHPPTRGATPTNLYPLAIDRLLRAQRADVALAWLRQADMGQVLRDHKALALLDTALCARSLGDDTTAAAAFADASADGLDVLLRPSMLRSEFAWRLADWHAWNGDWRSAFSVCAQCEAATRAELEDWLLLRLPSARPDRADRCSSASFRWAEVVSAR